MNYQLALVNHKYGVQLDPIKVFNPSVLIVVRGRFLCSQRLLMVSRRASAAECAADSVGYFLTSPTWALRCTSSSTFYSGMISIALIEG